MTGATVRDAVSGDAADICALNLAAVTHTSPMDQARLAVLSGLACYFKVACVAGQVAAFVLEMRDGVAYGNDNYQWFASRYQRFLYVDRVVVSPASRGLGSLLYEDLFRYARVNDIPLVTCEYNLVPPNEQSRRFHGKFGFREQGSQWVSNRTRLVSLQAATTMAE